MMMFGGGNLCAYFEGALSIYLSMYEGRLFVCFCFVGLAFEGKDIVVVFEIHSLWSI
jgi:hypothetical protein